jgi:hypothetical protein
MVSLIYSAYADAFLFIRRNLLAVIFVTVGVLLLVVARSAQFDNFVLSILFFLATHLFVPCLIDLYIVILIFRANKKIDVDVSISRQIGQYYKDALLIYIFSGSLAFIGSYPFFAYNRAYAAGEGGNHLITYYAFSGIFGLLLLCGRNFGLANLFLINAKPLKAILSGYKVLYENFLVCFLAFLLGIFLVSIPTFLNASNWRDALIFFSEPDRFQYSGMVAGYFSGLIGTWVFVASIYLLLYINRFAKE